MQNRPVVNPGSKKEKKTGLVEAEQATMEASVEKNGAELNGNGRVTGGGSGGGRTARRRKLNRVQGGDERGAMEESGRAKAEQTE